jgi:hypothetical protein
MLINTTHECAMICLKIPMGQSETVYRRCTDNTMAKWKWTNYDLPKLKKTKDRATRIPLKTFVYAYIHIYDKHHVNTIPPYSFLLIKQTIANGVQLQRCRRVWKYAKEQVGTILLNYTSFKIKVLQIYYLTLLIQY